jgi:hypothetical protein
LAGVDITMNQFNKLGKKPVVQKGAVEGNEQ